MELSRRAGARARKVLQRSRAAAPTAVRDSAAAVGDLVAAGVAAAVVAVGQQQRPLVILLSVSVRDLLN